MQDEAAHKTVKIAGFGLDGIHSIILRLSVVRLKIDKNSEVTKYNPVENICVAPFKKGLRPGDF